MGAIMKHSYGESNLDVQLRFLKETKAGQYTEIEPQAAATERSSEIIDFLNTEEKDYYYSFDC